MVKQTVGMTSSASTAAFLGVPIDHALSSVPYFLQAVAVSPPGTSGEADVHFEVVGAEGFHIIHI